MRLTDDELREIVKRHNTYSGIMRELGYACNGGGVQMRLKERCKQLKIDTSHFKGKGHGTSITTLHKLEDLLSGNKTYQGSNHLKKRLYKEGLLKEQCSRCGISEWMETTIVFHLDHVDGNNRNNSLDNLRILCPNCHSQTPTFSGRNVRRKILR